MYIMYVCLFSALSRRLGALQISIIIILSRRYTPLHAATLKCSLQDECGCLPQFLLAALDFAVWLDCSSLHTQSSSRLEDRNGRLVVAPALYFSVHVRVSESVVARS